MYAHFQRYLCVALIAKKQYQKAENILNKLIPFYKKRNTKVGSNLAQSRALLAVIYYERGEYKKSKHLLEQSIHILRENTGERSLIRVEAEKIFKKIYKNNL